MSDPEYDQVSERMQEEEKKMRQASKIQEAQYREAGKKEVESIGEGKFDAKLSFLLSRSKVRFSESNRFSRCRLRSS